MDVELHKRNVCACKGIRTCLTCERSKPFVLQTNNTVSVSTQKHHISKTPVPEAEYDSTVVQTTKEEVFYLTTHSTHFIYGYMASDIW